ncbi:hypothetical protein CLV51_102210 [Chitinophaga niastensis]|uniref:Uncharacterized protein n=1 Tax=Chitinophaga niastensis TaxID=536980 RepID=A0A2P8HMB9_CHINA|nr:hypothetical protein [Chitinophaga niastensis]PSL47364.1 hypothetical protein CLV51_102210 [Chitinophaga niastensis]
MDRFIAYFDILGFKGFIDNNDKPHVDRYFSHIFRESQSALSGGRLIDGPPGVVVPDVAQGRVNCMHISDSIIFWSIDNSEESFIDLVNVCYEFYWRCMQASFPIRGCMILGDIEFAPFTIPAANGATFYNSSMYGKGIIDAYLKGENQDWAGGYVDRSAINAVNPQTVQQLINEGKLILHPVPIKGQAPVEEHAFCIIQSGLNDIAYSNMVRSIENTFHRHLNGNDLHPSVQRKLDNTIVFLDRFRETPAE